MNDNAHFQSSLRFIFLIIFVFAVVCVEAQTTPPPQPAATPQAGGRTAGDPPRAASSANAREVEGAFNDLRSLEIPQTDASSKRLALIEITRNIYRKPTKPEMKVLAPSPDYSDRYAVVLRQPDTGVFKLNADSSCVESAGVIAAKENCLQYSMPGAGTAYSFRVESHRIPRLADLTLSKNVLKSDGILQHGILVKLGDVPLEDITMQTKGLKFLVDFEPLTDVESLAKFDRRLLEGIVADGFTYSLGFYVKDQMTYALRSIAYKGKAARSVNGITYNELDFDKRRDILVVFRIVGIEANGNVTAVWKLLSNKESPTLKIKQIKDDK